MTKGKLILATAVAILLVSAFLGATYWCNVKYTRVEIDDVRVMARGDDVFLAIEMRHTYHTYKGLANLGIGGPRESHVTHVLFGDPARGPMTRMTLSPGERLPPLVGLDTQIVAVRQDQLLRLTEDGLVPADVDQVDELAGESASELSEQNGWTWSFLPAFELMRRPEYNLYVFHHPDSDTTVQLRQYPWGKDGSGRVTSLGRQLLVVTRRKEESLRIHADHQPKRLVR